MPEMTLSGLLTLGKAMIKDPVHHCQGSLATNARNWTVDPTAPDAARWCAFGALCKAMGFAALKTDSGPFPPLLCQARDLIRLVDGRDRLLAEINDQGTHHDLMQLFDQAIEKAESTNG